MGLINFLLLEESIQIFIATHNRHTQDSLTITAVETIYFLPLMRPYVLLFNGYSVGETYGEREVMDGVGGDFIFLHKDGDKAFLYKHLHALSFLMFLLSHNSVFMLLFN